jgi:hypothetical protein
MSQAVESFLAKLYTDESFRRAFMGAPMEFALRSGLEEKDAVSVARINLVDLALAAESYQRKRASPQQKQG